MHGVTLGLANGAFLGAYALALWFGSTRVQAGAMTGPLQLHCIRAFAAQLTLTCKQFV